MYVSVPWILLAALLAAVIAAAVVVRRRRALDQMRRILNNLDNDQPTHTATERMSGKLGEFAREFNRVVAALETRLTHLKGDRRLLETVLEGMTEGVLAVDARRRLLFSNRAARALFGLPENAGGRLIAELIRMPRIQAAIESGLQRATPHQSEIHVRKAGAGSERLEPLVLHVHSTRLHGADSPGTIFVFHDVTELRRLERMRQDFVANASHEFKTPLASIRAYAETLLNGGLHDDEVNVRFLQRIEEQADRMNELVLDMLSLARLDAGQETFQHAPLPLKEALKRCVAVHRDRAAAKDLKLLTRLDALDDSLQVVAAEEALRQIVDNLVDNAIKYTPSGGTVRVRARAHDQSVEIEISDTGIGIPRDELSRVFERFYRIDRARSREVGGTGLGLAIVKHLVQSLGGKVRVESRVNSGSTFVVTLPRFQQLAAPLAHDPQPENTPPRGSATHAYATDES